MFIAKHNENIIGVLWIKDNNHISRFLIDLAYLGKGVGRMLFKRFLNEIEDDEAINEIKVNSSQVAVRAYEKLGFRKNSEEKVGNGMRYVPMVYVRGERINTYAPI